MSLPRPWAWTSWIHRIIALSVVAHLLVLSFCTLANASPPERIEIVLPDPAPALIQEAALRFAAELRALDFEVSAVNLRPASSEPKVTPVPSADKISSSPLSREVATALKANVIGQVSVSLNENKLQLLAHYRGSEAPLSQTITWDSSLTAEILAIRAVELLRAAMLQSLRADPQKESVSTPVQRFTHFKTNELNDETPPPERPKQELAPDASQTTIAKKKKAPRSPQPDKPIVWLPSAGLSIHGEGSKTSPSLAAELQASALIYSVFVGATVDLGLLPAQWSLDPGVVDVRHLSLLFRAGYRVPCPTLWECQLGLSAGFHEVYMNPQDTPGFSTESSRHSSLLLQGDILLGYFLDNGIGFVTHGRAGGLKDSPKPLDSAGSAPLGRPSWNVSLGLAFRSGN